MADAILPYQPFSTKKTPVILRTSNARPYDNDIPLSQLHFTIHIQQRENFCYGFDSAFSFLPYDMPTHYM
ncbi:MAG: hypothetical protein IJH40_04360 [Ruminococcus sp.]|uniref:hypothetical protein n=1 Tax=Ruminococcus sp. TaxID=41978 RepID=UPI002873AF40|nr:hypothetical protein [Ruminococcus sp.]MBQ3284857.1 hypothetical protein [Ruminococcus sp.]